jgi:para-nitrobenzyl esterase
MANVMSPMAKGLFQRAIVMSSPGFAAWFPNNEITQTLGQNFANAAGCPGDGESAARCLRALPTARVLQLQGTISSGGPYNHGQPFIDGTILTMSPEQAWTTGNFNKMPIMGGGTRDEAMFFYAGSLYMNTATVSRTGMSVPRTPEDYATATSAGAFCIWCNAERKMPPEVASAYPLAQYDGDAMYALGRVATDGGRCRELHVMNRMAEAGAPVYAYEFAYDQAPFYFPRFAGYKARAVHTGDLQFVFNGYHGGHLGVNLDQATGMPRDLNADETRLANLMVAQWTRFAQTGNPNGSGDAPWPRFKPDQTGQVFVQNTTPGTMSVPQFRADKKCDFFDPQLKY